MRLVSNLKYEGTHIIGDNAFSPVQVAHDPKKVKCPHPAISIGNHDYTACTYIIVKKDKRIFHCRV